MSKYAKLFFRRVYKDLKQKQLLPLKLLFFMHSSTILVLYPYLTIHMRELGISVEETAIMSAVSPVISILMPPLAGMFADKIGNFKVLLAFFSGLGGASSLLLLLVPVGRITLTYPDQAVLQVACNPDKPLQLSMHQQYQCLPLHPHPFEIDAKLEACGFACHAVLSENDSQTILNAKQYGIQKHNIAGNATTIVKYTLTDSDIHVPLLISETKNHKTLKNNDRYKTAIRKLSENVYFFPAYSMYNFACNESNEDSNSYDCLFGYKNQIANLEKRLDQNWKYEIVPKEQDEDDDLEQRLIFNVTKLEGHTTQCSSGFGDSNKEHISVTLPIFKEGEEKPYKHLDLGSCGARCIATAPRAQLCSNPSQIVELDMTLTFWSYLCVRVLVGVVSGTSFAMFEGAVIAILREHKADYGLQRIYATLGGMISSPLSGWLIDYASRGKGYTDFSPIFYLYATMKGFSAFLMLFINLEFKSPASSVIADVMSVLKKLEMIALFTACFVLGTSWGFIESFLFWLLQDLGGSKSLMGLTITVGGIVGIPLLVLSGPIIKKIGHANVIFIGFLFYAIRLVGYSLIYNPWFCLIFEAMESITFSLSFTAAVTYAAKLSTVTTDTSIQGMLGGIYYGVGKGAGSLVGGYLINAISIRTTFQVFAIFISITGVIYLAFYHFYMKQRPSDGTDITKKEVEKAPQGFVDIDLTKPVGNQDKPVNYEDAFTNLAFEDTEMEAMEEEVKAGDVEEAKKSNTITQ